MSSPLGLRLAALRERDFRLLFTATTITTFGDAVATIALTFAVLKTLHGSATELGVVVAARLVVSAAMLLAGGVISDRLPRNLVIVAASLIQGSAQAVSGVLLVSGHATVGLLVALQALYGLGDGLVLPAEIGLIPQTVSPERLQEANALQGLTRNMVFIAGPGVGGGFVLLGHRGPGIALLVDALTFLAAAAVMSRIRLEPVERAAAGFFHELREGWREFTSRTWLWSTVVLFGAGNVFFMFWGVLGPKVVNDRLGGAWPWMQIAIASGAGALVGGLIAMRYRPTRPLVACVALPLLYIPRLVAVALLWPLWLVVVTSFLAGLGIAVHLALWFTTFQQEIPEYARSRVSSYDALGSFVLNPLGAAIAGPVAAAMGFRDALLLAALAIACLNLVMLLIPSVWEIRRREPETTMAVA